MKELMCSRFFNKINDSEGLNGMSRGPGVLARGPRAPPLKPTESRIRLRVWRRRNSSTGTQRNRQEPYSHQDLQGIQWGTHSDWNERPAQQLASGPAARIRTSIWTSIWPGSWNLDLGKMENR